MTESLQFSQSDGLKKTYAHYLLFKENSPTLKAVIEAFVPDKDRQKLFIDMFNVLNKEHVKNGLQQFGALTNRGFSGFSEKKHLAMSTYIKNPFNAMTREIYENKFLIDAIHEAVIHYFPKDGAISDSTDQEDKDIIQGARDNLKKSLNGYIGTTRKEYIPALEDPLEKIDDLAGMLKDIKTDVIDKLPNVLELEAVAELHRRAFLTVDKKDALEVIAHAHIDQGEKADDPKAKTLYVFKKENNEYMVSSIKLNNDFKKYIKNGEDCWAKAKEEEPKKGGSKKSTKKARTRGI